MPYEELEVPNVVVYSHHLGWSHTRCHFVLWHALVENTHNWAWILRMLLKSIDKIDDPSIPFISDRQKGLHTAMQEVFPHIMHGHYTHHLHRNVKTGHGKAAEKFFLGCVYAHTPSQ